MILRLAFRSVSAHPVRGAVLVGGFGLGVAVMATLLGVGEVILAQARAPELQGGGDVVITGAAGDIGYARYLLANVLGTSPLRERVRAAAPRSRSLLYLVRDRRVVPIRGHGGIPSLERALGDRETSSATAWTDAPSDAAWASPAASELLRSMDLFHPVPEVPARAASWAEWLYFNGRAGSARFYLTFMVGPQREGGRRSGGVRLQLEQDGRRASFAHGQEIDGETVLAEAPNLTIGTSRVRLEGTRYHIVLDLPAEGSSARVQGELFIDAASGRSMPPITIRGAGGWLSGYVVPVMSGALSGSLLASGERIALDGGIGYHDHNWGFWDGVTWQWGQVQHDDLSLVYGRLHPPANAADPARVPGFLAVLGPEGPIGYASNVTIEEATDTGASTPRTITVRGHGPALDLTMELRVEDAVITAMPQGAFGGGMEFFQMRAGYRVSGHAAGRTIDFVAPGSAETFRGK